MSLNDILLNPLLLAPMAGYTDHPFRTVCRKNGAGLVYTELISCEGIVRNNKKTMDLLKSAEKDNPIAIQLFGKNVSSMAGAAKIIEELKPTLIDINLGCCAHKVFNSGSGAGLLKDLKLAEKIVTEVVKAVKISVSAKIRLGVDSKTKNYRDTVKMLENAGVSMIAVHGRTRSQFYSGSADWEAISEICTLTNVPIIGNGDIQSFEEAHDRLKTSGCRGVMIGRASIGNPWIFSGKKPSFSEKIDQAKEHLCMMVDFFGTHGIIMARKHILKYLTGFHDAAHYRSDILKSADLQEVLDMLNAIKSSIEAVY